MQLIISFFFLLFSVWTIPSKDYMVSMVNDVRSEGCYCGRTWMPPVENVRWNRKLYRSAYAHAGDMHLNNFFDHVNKKGQDIGDRIDKVGYKWKVIGENIGVGQHTFSQVLQDWIDSPTHCKMLMNPKVDEMAVAKKGKYWVQHFGKQMESHLTPIRKRKRRS